MLNSDFPSQVCQMMAERSMRLHHFLWHETRNMWLMYSEADRATLKDMGWEPPHPARDAGGNWNLNNGSGKDFFFMHRQMIAMVNDMLAGIGNPNYPKVVGFNAVPAPADVAPPPVYSVPGDDGSLAAFLQRVKSDNWYTAAVPLEQHYRDPDWLGATDLGELGARVESTLHNNMHMRYSAECSMYLGGASGPTSSTIPVQYDDPAYNWLGDTYSSHVNGAFWLIHGWVDDRAEDWRKANALDEIDWTNCWAGPAMSMPGMTHDKFDKAARSAELDRAVTIIAKYPRARFWDSPSVTELAPTVSS